MNKDVVNRADKFDGKDVMLEGEIFDLKKIILARDNYYSFKLKIAPKKWVKVRYYSIVDLLQVNSFYCKEGYWTTLKGRFKFDKTNKNLGEIHIKKKSLMICTEQPKKEPKKGPENPGT